MTTNNAIQIIEQLAILNSRVVGIVKLKQHEIIWCNDAFAHLFGYLPEELTGQSVRVLYQNDEAYQSFWNTSDQALGQGSVVRTQLQLKHKNGTLEWYEASGERPQKNCNESIWAFINISEHKHREKTIQKLAFCDALTNLPNRRMLSDRLEQVLKNGAYEVKYGALMMLDLDHFKQVNDSFGHEAGDSLLIEVGNRLKACVREADTVARIGGDEFIVLVAELSDDLNTAKHRAELIAEKIRAVLAEPYENSIRSSSNDNNHYSGPMCSASIGVVMFPQDQRGSDDYMKFADAAMYQAKKSGGNRYYFQAN